MDSTLHILGVRHHGPGSARSVLCALEELGPDCVLVEGPPDAEDILPLMAADGMKPPVAILVYVPDEPRKAVYYPFAIFSPEWQGIQYALRSGIPVRFMDLPQWHQLGEREAEPLAASQDGAPEDSPQSEDAVIPDGAKPQAAEGDEDSSVSDDVADQPPPEIVNLPELLVRRDPLQYLAEAAGYIDGERWWEHMVEERHEGTQIFDAILEAMLALRESGAGISPLPSEQLREARREAYMRQTIRAAQKEGFKKVAVICGAWHAPAMAKMPASAKEGAATLKGLPKVKTAATWVPWTYGRLTYASGYGAGIDSPGWYHHLWDHYSRQRKVESSSQASLPDCADTGKTRWQKAVSNAQGTSSIATVPAQTTTSTNGPSPANGASGAITISWMARVARLLRQEDLDASSASVIESVRLAESLAAFRGRPLPGLVEMNESAQTVFCFGGDAPMRLIHDRLIVGQRLGEVPDEAPAVPLHQDLQREQKRLRFPPEASQKTVDLDLRKPNDLDRSRLLHRLALLNVPWGALAGEGSGKGTFHEIWRVQWEPEFAVKLIEAAVWGNTVFDAATGFARHLAAESPDLPSLTKLIDGVILADLPEAVRSLVDQLQERAALAVDVSHLMDALPPLAHIVRYGNVRKTDAGMITHVLAGLIARICIGLPPATASLNDEAAAEMFDRLLKVNAATTTLQNESYLSQWQDLLLRLADQENLHGLLAGRAVRLLLDAGRFSAEQSAQHMSLALSKASDPPQAAAWIEGFLKGSGQLLLHDERLWGVIDDWLTRLSGDTFTQLLPLLRRTFATFPAPERRQMGERVKRGSVAIASQSSSRVEDLDHERAARVLPVLAQLLGASA